MEDINASRRDDDLSLVGAVDLVDESSEPFDDSIVAVASAGPDPDVVVDVVVPVVLANPGRVEGGVAADTETVVLDVRDELDDSVFAGVGVGSLDDPVPDVVVDVVLVLGVVEAFEPPVAVGAVHAVGAAVDVGGCDGLVDALGKLEVLFDGLDECVVELSFEPVVKVLNASSS